MQSNRWRHMACAVMLLLPAGQVLAHDTWIEPQAFLLRSGDVAAFDLTSGHAFPEAEHAIKHERLARAECRVAGKSQRMRAASVQPKSLRLAVRLQHEGAAVCAVELKPRSIELTEEQVAAYLDEIDAPDAIRRDWAAAPRPRAWRETYAKYAKSMVGTGAWQKDGTWSKSAGMAFEIVPETDPLSVRAGEELAVRVLRDGSPLGGLSLALAGMRTANTWRRTDAEGRAKFVVPAAGRWIVRGTDLRGEAGGRWRSRFTTLVFEAQPGTPEAAARSQPDSSLRLVANPAGALARLPRLASLPRGGLLASWIAPTADGNVLRFAVWRDGAWSPSREVVRGIDWFVNWADFPGVVPITERFWSAHWLVKQRGGKSYHYDIALALTTDAGASWSKPVTPHRDGAAAEHGFVSVFARGERAGLVWLDGRDYISPKDGAEHSHDGKSGNFALRYTEVAPDGALAPELVLDDNVCTCCLTAAAVTPAGPVVAYRGRRKGEIRDNFVVRLTGTGWGTPAPLGGEGWHMPACPVNGPALAASGLNVVAAWYTAEGNRPRVRAALSRDGGKSFGRAIEVDDRDPLGRVAVAWQDAQTAVVAWMTAADPRTKNSSIALRSIELAGGAGPVARLVEVSPGRDTGMPQLVSDGSQLMIAWTAPVPAYGVRTALIDHAPRSRASDDQQTNSRRGIAP